MNFLALIARTPSYVRVGSLLLTSAALAGCGRNDVQVYRVAKEQVQAQPAALPSGHPDTASGVPRLQWKLPAGWEEAAPGEMRAASFRIKGKDGKMADVGVFPLPGMAGSDLDNVNRWRGQVGLAPVSEPELGKLAQAVEVSGQAGQFYDLAGMNGASGEKSRILAAILRREGVAWFFKMTGDDALVAEQKPAFVEFLKSLTLSAASAQPELPPSHPPIDSAAMTQMAAGGATASAPGKPTWEVPSSWKETPAGQFLVAKYVISGADNTQAAVNVSMSAGEGDGVLGNVNRWRQQLGLGSLPESDVNQLVNQVEVSGGKALVVDMTGTDARTGQKTRLLGAIVPKSGETWFYKLMGHDQLVEREKEAFVKFLQTAKYPNAH